MCKNTAECGVARMTFSRVGFQILFTNLPVSSKIILLGKYAGHICVVCTCFNEVQ